MNLLAIIIILLAVAAAGAVIYAAWELSSDKEAVPRSGPAGSVDPDGDNTHPGAGKES